MRWEKHYIRALIETLHPFGDVLEVGFKRGFAAFEIQQYHPRSHVLIEADCIKAKEAKKWAEKHPSARVIEDTWQNALPHLGIFDAIFFEASPPIQVERLRVTKSASTEILREGEALLRQVVEEFPELTRLRYTDSELEELCMSAAKSAAKQLSRFLSELEHNGQITSKQKQRMVKKYHLPESKAPPIFPLIPDPLLPFLRECLQSHMRKGSVFSCFSPCPVSKYEDPQFVDAVIVNPVLEYREFSIPVRPPKSCRDYPYREALILKIEKLA